MFYCVSQTQADYQRTARVSRQSLNAFSIPSAQPTESSLHPSENRHSNGAASRCTRRCDWVVRLTSNSTEHERAKRFRSDPGARKKNSSSGAVSAPGVRTPRDGLQAKIGEKLISPLPDADADGHEARPQPPGEKFSHLSKKNRGCPALLLSGCQRGLRVSGQKSAPIPNIDRVGGREAYPGAPETGDVRMQVPGRILGLKWVS